MAESWFEVVEKCLNVAIIYCSGHSVGDDFESTGKEFNNSSRCSLAAGLF